MGLFAHNQKGGGGGEATQSGQQGQKCSKTFISKFSTFSDDVEAEEQRDFDADPSLPLELRLGDSNVAPGFSVAERESRLAPFKCGDDDPDSCTLGFGLRSIANSTNVKYFQVKNGK